MVTVGGEDGVAADITTQGCAAFGQYPVSACDADHDLVSRTTDGIQFGARPADNDMCTPAKRPTALSPLVSKRQ